MADMDTICARLCLLTRAAWKDDLPQPMRRASLQCMLRLGALHGLALREVEGIGAEQYVRAKALLSRASEIYDRLLSLDGYRVIVPEDDCWPVGLHALGRNMPLFLFVRGDVSLLGMRSVAVAGSRKILRTTEDAARACGKEIAEAGLIMVSGGAHGVDTAAQNGCLSAGGSMVLVPALSAQQLLAQSAVRHALYDGRLLLVCDTWPDEPFSPAKALSRNHTIYALGDAALVVASRKAQGGSWDGAAHCLRGGYTPVYAVDAPGADYEGNHALFELGAHRFDLTKPLDMQIFGGKEACI